MFRAMEVFGRMLVLRAVATAHMPALKAASQVYPGTARLKTFLATVRSRGRVVSRFQMCAEIVERGHEAPGYRATLAETIAFDTTHLSSRAWVCVWEGRGISGGSTSSIRKEAVRVSESERKVCTIAGDPSPLPPTRACSG
jgi:hypothetical protein